MSETMMVKKKIRTKNYKNIESEFSLSAFSIIILLLNEKLYNPLKIRASAVHNVNIFKPLCPLRTNVTINNLLSTKLTNLN